MKKTILSILAIATVSATIIACSNSETKEKSSDTINSKTEAVSVQYTCPMHPEVISDKPGQCPKCGMDLIKKETSEKTEMKSDSTVKM